MATKMQNLADPASCFNRAAEDEPIFVLRAHDPLAPDAVRRWSYTRMLHRGTADVAAAEAAGVADAMEEWRKVHGG
jgi:hypothetical protein